MNQSEYIGKVIDMVSKSSGINPAFAKAITPDAGLMSVVCAWCGRDMGKKMGPTGAVSHGICASCADKERAKLDQQAILARITAAIYDSMRKDLDHWPLAVDAAYAVMNVLDEMEMLHTGEQTSVEEGRAHVEALKERGPLAVELAEEDRA